MSNPNILISVHECYVSIETHEGGLTSELLIWAAVCLAEKTDLKPAPDSWMAEHGVGLQLSKYGFGCPLSL